MKVGRIVLSIIFILCFSILMVAQHQDIAEKPEVWKGDQNVVADTTVLLHAFKHGSIQGHFRYYFMATDNQNNYKDYYANALGGGLRFETAKYFGFQFAISGFYVFNTLSSDLSIADPASGSPNRYEIGLFDIENPYNRKDIDRLEEFYLKYSNETSTIIFGRQLINTPFINLQDGRMRPTGVEGLWYEYANKKKLSVNAGWLYAISPRGTTKWYYVGESMGVYPPGVNTDGTKSQYASNIKSNGVFMAGATYHLNQNFKVQLWNQFTENVFNSALIQADFETKLNNQHKFFFAIQGIRQDAINSGGNSDPSKTYFPANSFSQTYGARVGLKNSQHEISLNYNHITRDGRYLMPREWGREPFFTFLPRERNEGYGASDALMAKYSYQFRKHKIKTSLASGLYKLPEVTNFRLNKYGMPSYLQINADVRYFFQGKLSGLESQLLIVGKYNLDKNINNPKYIVNKVNMVLFNLVLNYHF